MCVTTFYQRSDILLHLCVNTTEPHFRPSLMLKLNTMERICIHSLTACRNVLKMVPKICAATYGAPMVALATGIPISILEYLPVSRSDIRKRQLSIGFSARSEPTSWQTAAISILFTRRIFSSTAMMA